MYRLGTNVLFLVRPALPYHYPPSPLHTTIIILIGQVKSVLSSAFDLVVWVYIIVVPVKNFD